MKRPLSKRDNRSRTARPTTRTGTGPNRLRHGQGRLRQTLLPALLLVGIAAAVFATHRRSLPATALCMNDGTYVTQNYRVQHPSWRHAGLFLAEVARPSTVEGYYQPLTMISLMLDSALGGRAPDHLMPYHRTSLALHIANTLLLTWFVHRLFGQIWTAAMVGLIFGLHPLAVEPITWLGERKTVLATFFALWCLLAYVQYARRGGWQFYATCTSMFVLALLAKPTVTPLPALLLVLDFWPLQRLSWRALIEKTPLFAIAGIFAVITVVSQQHSTLARQQEITSAQAFLLGCHNLLFYPLKMLWPVRLSTVYPFPEPINLSHPMILAGLLTTSVLAIALIVSLKRTRALLAGALFFILALSPTMLNVGYAFTVAADKYVYLPAIGLLLVLGWALGRICGGEQRANRALFTRRAGITAAVLCVAVAEALASRRYAAVWQDTGQYCRNILSIAPKAAWAHDNLSVYLLDKNNPREAAEHARRAVELDERNPKAWVNLGQALLEANEIDEAIDCFERGLQITEKLPEAHNGLGMAHGRKGQWAAAVGHFETALAKMPHSDEILFNLGTACMHAGQFEKAFAHLEAVRRSRPENSAVLDRLAEAHFLRGQALARQDRISDALPHFEKAVEFRPAAVQARSSLAHARAALGQVDAAMADFREVIRLSPNDPEPLCSLGDLFAGQDRLSEAIGAYRTALKLDPDHKRAAASLESALRRQSPDTGPS